MTIHRLFQLIPVNLYEMMKCMANFYFYLCYRKKDDFSKNKIEKSAIKEKEGRGYNKKTDRKVNIRSAS